MFKQKNGGEKQPITQLNAPIRIVIDIPADLLAKGSNFGIIRVHTGVATLLNDLDDNPNTITFDTDRFSTYAIVYLAGAAKTLVSIAVTAPPSKTTYTAGQSFNSAGMVVTATYSDGSTAVITGYTVVPSGVLTSYHTAVTISYTENGVTKTVTQAVTVSNASGGGIPDTGDDGIVWAISGLLSMLGCLCAWRYRRMRHSKSR